MSTTRSPSRPAPATDPAADVGVLLVGHGAARRPEVVAVLARQARAVAAAVPFARVRYATLAGGPDPATELQGLDGCRRVLVLPLFMSDGHVVRDLLPERLGPAGRDDRVHLCPPLGLSPELAVLAGEVSAEARGRVPRDPLLVIAAHGSPADPASRRSAEALARRLARGATWAAVKCAFLEEPPALADVLAALHQPAVLLGLFAAPGGHAARDVPKALESAARPVAYTGALGADPRVGGVAAAILVREIRALSAAA